MKACIIAIACVAFLARYGGAADDNIPGVTGTKFLIEKKKENAGNADQVTCKVGDKIEITWIYPVVPGEIPKRVGAKSDSKNVKCDGIRNVIRPHIVGAGVLGAYFSAESKGKAILQFDINDGGGGAILKCEVDVTD